VLSGGKLENPALPTTPLYDATDDFAIESGYVLVGDYGDPMDGVGQQCGELAHGSRLYHDVV
jgi:hypothetical protein